MTRVSRRSLLVVVSLLALAATLAGSSAPAGGAVAPDWRGQLAERADDTLVASAAAYKRRIAEPLAPFVSPPLGAADLEAVAADAESRYPDGDRPLDRPSADVLFGHDHVLATGLQALLNAGTGDETVLVTGLADLLLSERTTVEAMLADARLLADGGHDATSVEQGERAYDQALEAWAKGEPVSAVAHFRQAADRAFDVLDRHGVRYDPFADRDGDGVPDILELRAHGDPRAPDTDGDGLGDAFEILHGGPWHLVYDPDSDADGTGDALEDADGEGLDARGEQDAAGDPLVPDTDGDGLTDAAEAGTHATRPDRADTDGDGLDDGAELRAGTDPLDPDTDDDGIPDGEDVNTATVTTGGVEVELTGVGDLAGALDVRSRAGEPFLSGAPGQVGPAYEIELDRAAAGGLQRAALELPFDPDAFQGDEADLRVFVFDEERQWWQPAGDGQVVDEEANTVRAEVPHFSIFAVFDIRNWDAEWTALGGTCKPRDGGGGDPVFIDVAFVLDSSGSMITNDPQGFRRTAAKIFVDALHEQDRGAVVDFDSIARLFQALTSDKALLKAAIDRVDSSGGTNIGAGVSLGLSALAAGAAPPRAQLMILLTDGVGSYNHLLTTQAASAGVTIYTIGLGSGIDANLLQSIATGTGGSFHHVANAEDLPDVFRTIEDDTGDDGTDTDGDGLTDCQEEKGVQDSAGFLTFTSDPRLPDTDGDGLSDGDEVGEPIAGPGLGLVFTVFSDPRLEDTDGDGLSDPLEADAGSRARSNETDGDGLGDLDELAIGTDPTITDTDGDGQGDGYEHLNRHGGFDPLVPTEVLSVWDYVGDFLLGATCGELLGSLCQRDTIAWLAGNVASGFAIVGDLRDAIGLLFQGDLVGAGLSVFSLVPIGGDAASVVAKTTKFVFRVTGKAGDALKTILRSDLPSWAKLRILEDLSSSGVARLRTAGLDDDTIIRLGRAGMDPRHLDDVLAGAADVTRKGFLDWRAAEGVLRQTLGGSPRGFKTVLGARGTTGMRFVDAYDEVADVAREAKTGFTRLTPFVQRQIDRDVLLRARGDFARVEWHFFTSSVSETVGPSAELLSELNRRGIPYVIHLP